MRSCWITCPRVATVENQARPACVRSPVRIGSFPPSRASLSRWARAFHEGSSAPAGWHASIEAGLDPCAAWNPPRFSHPFAQNHRRQRMLLQFSCANAPDESAHRAAPYPPVPMDTEILRRINQPFSCGAPKNVGVSSCPWEVPWLQLQALAVRFSGRRIRRRSTHGTNGISG